MNLTLRPVCGSAANSDEALVRQLVMETAAEELGAQSWPQAVRAALLETQYTSRCNSLRAHYPNGQSCIIRMDGEDVGWIFIAETDDELRVADIVLSKSWRGRGIGTAVLRGVMERAGRVNKPVRLHVRSDNAGAIRLYERLGFRRIGGDEMNLLLEHSSAQTAQPY
jgi:ribosomal protein S18 acetylase RimI-like enzyme